MTEIPTMACKNCGGKGWFICASPYPCDARHDCAECRSTGRRKRPPLTAKEITALPDGARVVACIAGLGYVDGYAVSRDWLEMMAAMVSRSDLFDCRVWLAADGGEG